MQNCGSKKPQRNVWFRHAWIISACIHKLSLHTIDLFNLDIPKDKKCVTQHKRKWACLLSVHRAAKATASDAQDQYKIIPNMYIFSSFSLFISCVYCFVLMVYGLAYVGKVHVRNHFSLESNMYIYHGCKMYTWKKKIKVVQYVYLVRPCLNPTV